MRYTLQHRYRYMQVSLVNFRNCMKYLIFRWKCCESFNDNLLVRPLIKKYMYLLYIYKPKNYGFFFQIFFVLFCCLSFLRNLNLCHIYSSTRATADLRHLAENAVRRKRSLAPTLTLTQTKCGLKVSLGLSFYGINQRIMRTNLKTVVVVVDKCRSTICRAPITGKRSKIVGLRW